jgi:hypothetical protein
MAAGMSAKTRSDFAHFYATVLLKDLKPLETMRRAVLRKVTILILVIAAIVACALAIAVGYRLGFGPIAVTSVLAISAGGFIYRLLVSEYVRRFKHQVVAKIVGFIDPALEYWPEQNIGQTHFVSSGMFDRRPDRFRGDDYVKGRVGATPIEFSEIHAEYKTESHSRRGRRRNWHTIFKGLFFIAEFNKHFCCRTVVLPDTAEWLLGGAGTFFQGLNKSRGELIKLEDPEFEKLFVVYGEDQVEARYVLSTSLMERIVNFRRKTGRKVYLSFADTLVYVAVSYRKALFEPRVFSTILDFKSAEAYFDDLHLALGIVDDLNLNTRIWTRQPGVTPV